MEYEIDDQPQGANGAAEEDDNDSAVVRDHRALKNQSSVNPRDYPDRKDRALEIPEQEDDQPQMR
ncbi:hypothetical protein [Aurantiacibacter spongiae]|uniref:Uncharacterized protein n=1 Tax=Aurantiacibacter spongiae TaxID=2488860 RepID=A0A3N5CNW4_9SPHN|nr:hypothetical protein [Aurantiacibacter spongiae]RPF70267.1 hypothetical protein EG799_00465 [Aurantiacibacter spongiae]